jgi:hypothetical protein
MISVGDGRTRTARPRDDAPRLPRHLQLRAAGRGRRSVAGIASARAAAPTGVAADRPFGGEPRERDRQPPLLRLEVRDHLVALLAGQRASARHVFLGVAQHAEEGSAPRGRVGFEHRELFRRRHTVGLCFDIHVELPGAEIIDAGVRSHRSVPPKIASRRRVSILRIVPIKHSARHTTEDAGRVLEEGPAVTSGCGAGPTGRWVSALDTPPLRLARRRQRKGMSPAV